MRRSILIPLLLGALAAWCGSCIENNLPYPVVELAVLSCEGEGFTAEIDAKTRTVVLRLDETTDISRVRITDMRITAEARASAPLTGEFDLRTPQFITLSLYQDYEWELRAEQRIERRFAVEGQIGAAEIDSERRTATAHVGMDADLRAVRITDLKLGPEGITTLNPAPEELTDFSSVRYVYVTYHDFEERWALYVRQTELVVALSAAMTHFHCQGSVGYLWPRIVLSLLVSAVWSLYAAFSFLAPCAVGTRTRALLSIGGFAAMLALIAVSAG